MTGVDVLRLQAFAVYVALLAANPVAAAAVIAYVEYQAAREVRGVHVRRLALDLRRVRDRLAEGT